MNMPPNSPALPRIASGDLQPSARDVLRLLRNHLWEVIGIAAAITAIAVAYALLATPIFSSDVLVRVDAPEANAFGIAPQGQVMTQPTAPPTDAEIAIMQSRSVLEPVIQQYKFDVVAQPHAFPILGALAAKFATAGQPARAWFGLDSFAWGGEQIDIGSFNVPEQMEDEKFELKALDNKQYALFDESGNQVLTGTVGQAAQADGISLMVNQLVARPDTRFTVSKSNAVNTVTRFQRDLKVVDDGKDTGVVRITYDNSNAAVATGVANGIAQSYIAASIASHQATDGKTLAFIQQELPRLHSDLAQAETDLSAYQTSSGSMQPATEAQAYLQGGIDYQKQIALLQLQRTQLLSRFTPDSPDVHNVDQQIAQLNSAKQGFDSRFNSMPVSERKNADLTRDAKVADSIYVAMVSKAEELSVRRAGTTGNAHIVDTALRPSRPLTPKQPMIIAGGVGVGLIIGVLFVFVRRHVFAGVTNPMFVEHYLNVPLFGSIAYSGYQTQLEAKKITDSTVPAARQLDWKPTEEAPQARHAMGPRIALARTAASSLPASAHRLLARSFPQDPSIESMRIVRTALRLEMVHAPNKVVTLTGPTPATGKSFIAANLAALLAEAGTRVLLIDADMRRGHLAEFFGQSNAGGLVEVLRGDLPLRNAIRPVGIENLSLLSCGTYPSNPSELLARSGFGQMLASLELQYDMVIIDTPPFLPVTDAAIIANQAGVTLLVLRSGMQTKQELEDTVRGLDRTGARLVGAVFNGVPAQSGVKPAYGYVARHRPEPGASAAKAA